MFLLNLHIFSQSVSAGALIWDGIFITKITVENENLNHLNTVLSVEFLVFTCCTLDEQETDFIPTPICRTGKNTAVGLPKKTHRGIISWSKALYLYLLLHCTLGAVLRCKRDKGLHGKIDTMESSQCWNPKFAFGERGLNPCYASGKKSRNSNVHSPRRQPKKFATLM